MISEYILDKLKQKNTPITKKGFDVQLQNIDILNENIDSSDSIKITENTDTNTDTNKHTVGNTNIIVEDRRDNVTVNRSLILQQIFSGLNTDKKTYKDNYHDDSDIIPTIITKSDPFNKDKKIVLSSDDSDSDSDKEAISENVIKSRRVINKDISNFDFNGFLINGKDISKRLPKEKSFKESHKASPFYMQNRKLFIEKINKLFQPYKDEKKSMEEISCDSRKYNDDFSLLLHQKIVRDYLNLYTPYRGILLMHGLGSGKTCTSIAIAEGMKTDKKVILMTPASLKTNFFAELKKCGDSLFKKKQYWEFISTVGQPDYVNVLSSALSLPKDFIEKHNGAWLVDVKKKSNINDLSPHDQRVLDAQLDAMIHSKYFDINYNGMNTNKLNLYTKDGTINFFDNSVVVIDEAHNFVSMIVNKIKVKEQNSISYTLYQLLMSAKNARIVLLTGTPIINYPNEISVLFNILRGNIKTWTFPISLNTSKKLNTDKIKDIFSKEGLNTYDYLEFTNNKLTITRNPYGFVNHIKPNKSNDSYNGVILDETGNIDDKTFKDLIIDTLQKHDLQINKKSVKEHSFKAIPDDADIFNRTFINPDYTLKNKHLLQTRILGLTSYFKSAEEKLLPSFILTKEGSRFHIISTEMSDYQFSEYEKIRKNEADSDIKALKRSRKKSNITNDINNINSSYRIFSRLCCNFVFPKQIKRPTNSISKDVNESSIDAFTEDTSDIKYNNLKYQEEIQDALLKLSENSSKYLSTSGLLTHSPKFLEILHNLKNKDHTGLHLIYSVFRTVEGIGILKLILEQNGFSCFKLKKVDGMYSIDTSDSDTDKPKFFLYTGTEDTEEKEIMRNIYNSSWELVPANISNELRKIHTDNFNGEIVKIMMITAAGAEGINLRNTRYVHIVEPYWNMVRLDQVIGRARRICSHEDLPEKLRTIQVFLYMTTLSHSHSHDDSHKELQIRDRSRIDNKTPITTDEYLFEISNQKDNINKQIISAIHETSIDCDFHDNSGKANCFNYGKISSNDFSSLPDIEKDEIQKISVGNKVTITNLQELTFNGSKYAYDKNTGNVYHWDSYQKNITSTGNPLIKYGHFDGKTIVPSE